MVGIDYGLGTTNVDRATGIRYGVIPAHSVGEYWYDSAESQYGDPTCGYCGTAYPEDTDLDTRSVVCPTCGKESRSDDVYPEDPIAHTYEGDGYQITQGSGDTDLFVLKSPYYTRCAYCSPCAPGAGYLTQSVDDGIKAYCLGPDWFEGEKAPYPVYRVSDDTRVD